MAEALPEPAINTRDRIDGALSSSRRLCMDRQFRSGRPKALSSSHRPSLRTSDIKAAGWHPIDGVPWGWIGAEDMRNEKKRMTTNDKGAGKTECFLDLSGPCRSLPN